MKNRFSARKVTCNILHHNNKNKNKNMAEIKKCATCGCSCGGDEEEKVETPAPEADVETPAEEGQTQMKSFRLHRHSNDTEFAVLLALVPAMTMTLFNLMGLI
jgi:hypothetical protein